MSTRAGWDAYQTNLSHHACLLFVVILVTFSQSITRCSCSSRCVPFGVCLFLLEVGLFIWLLFEKKMATTWWGLQMLINYRYEGKSWRKIVMLKKSRGGKRYATRSTKTPESAHEKEKQTKSRGTTQVTSTGAHVIIPAVHYSPRSRLSCF